MKKPDTHFQTITESATAEVSTVTVPADVNGSYAGTYFSVGTNLYVWFDVLADARSVDPAISGKTAIRVTLSANDADNSVATDIVTAINAAGNTHVAAGTDNVITITAQTAGPEADTDAGTSPVSVVITTQGTGDFSGVEAFLLYGVNPGLWNNDVKVRIRNSDDYPNEVQVSNAFIIDVFAKGNDISPVESFLCSRDPSAKDGFGRNLYVEERLKASAYLRAIDNPNVVNTVLPKSSERLRNLGGGADGALVTQQHMITGLQKFENPDDLPITIIVDGGYATASYQREINRVCESRNDCVGILSTPYSLESSSNYLNDIIDYRRTTLNLSTSYCGLYTGWLRIYDRFNDRNLYIAPDSSVVSAINFSAQNQEIWFPAAGFRRGQVNALDVRRRYNQAERDLLYANDINPIRFAPGRGIAIFGQKTLLGIPSALDRMNVRLLLVVIQPAIKELYENFLFEFNDFETRTRIKSIVDEYMFGIQGARGVSDFITVIDETNNPPAVIDANEMNLDVFIKPNRSAEFLRFTTVITPTGVNFSELLTAQ